jgi:ribonuclease R
MQRANYTHTREWHFGLAIDYYSHFTSPIRRYPDLQIHRIIKECLSNHWELTEERNYHYESILETVAEKSSIEQDKAVFIEREINKMMWVKYMRNKIWEEFSWYLSWIDQRWVFIELENTITWIIHDEKRYSLESIWDKWLLFELSDSNWDKYNVWDKIKVKLTSIDEDKLNLKFDIVK